MLTMAVLKPAHAEARVEQQRKPPEDRICDAEGRRQRSVHCVMSNDEQPDVEPAGQKNEEGSCNKASASEVKKEDAVNMHCQPADHQCCCKAKPNEALSATVQHSTLFASISAIRRRTGGA